MAQEIIFLTGAHEADFYLDKGFLVIHNPNQFIVRITTEGANIRPQRWVAVSESDPSIEEEEARGTITVLRKTAPAPKKKAKEPVAEDVVETIPPTQVDASNDADEKKDVEVHQES